MIEQWGDPCPIEPGTIGVVTDVDEVDYIVSRSVWDGTKLIESDVERAKVTTVLTVEWETNRSLYVLLPVDKIELYND